MSHPFEAISLPLRSKKPRNSGFTMVLDKNLSIQSLQGLLETAAEYIDLIKFGWGTSKIFPIEILRKKIELSRMHEILVGPGGTFFEIAYAQNKFHEFLTEAKDMGLTCIEISDGTVKIPHEKKIESIKKAKSFGFTVLSEIGKKDPVKDKRYSIDERVNNALDELHAGAFKVIMEARESGTVGIFDADGKVIPEFVEKMISKIGMENIVFEAPLTTQQEWFISNLGPSINLGNIAPGDCINLETLRCGLRSATLTEYHVDKTSIIIENGVGGAFKAAERNDVIIVVDALRVSSTIITALAEGGFKSVKPVTSVEECVGEVTAGERGGQKIPNLDYNNSPLTFKNGNFKGKELILTGSNGTECIKASSIQKSPILIASLINAKAAAKRALDIAHKTNRNITIAMAGRNNQLAIEDLISASEIIANIPDCVVKGNIMPVFSKDFASDFVNSDSGKNLVALGSREDVVFCAQKDIYDIVPEYKNGLIINGEL